MADRLWVNQLQLTIADLVAEAHNVHHPISAHPIMTTRRRPRRGAADGFRNERMPKFLELFRGGDRRRAGDWLTGHRWSYADLSLFQLVEGLRYAFPKRMSRDRGRLSGR